MKTEAELVNRLKEAVEARQALLEEELQSEDAQDEGTANELAQNIEHLTGVIMTLEWVLGEGAWMEYTETETETEA